MRLSQLNGAMLSPLPVQAGCCRNPVCARSFYQLQSFLRLLDAARNESIFALRLKLVLNSAFGLHDILTAPCSVWPDILSHWESVDAALKSLASPERLEFLFGSLGFCRLSAHSLTQQFDGDNQPREGGVDFFPPGILA